MTREEVEDIVEQFLQSLTIEVVAVQRPVFSEVVPKVYYDLVVSRGGREINRVRLGGTVGLSGPQFHRSRVEIIKE